MQGAGHSSSADEPLLRDDHFGPGDEDAIPFTVGGDPVSAFRCLAAPMRRQRRAR